MLVDAAEVKVIEAQISRIPTITLTGVRARIESSLAKKRDENTCLPSSRLGEISEIEFQRKLNLTRVTHRPIHLSKRTGVADVGGRRGEIRMIESVEKLGTEFQAR